VFAPGSRRRQFGEEVRMKLRIQLQHMAPRLLALVGGVGTAGLILLGGGVAQASPDFPLASTGDIWFQVDYAGFRGNDGGVQEEYYFKISNNQLTFQPDADSTMSGKVYVELTFKDADDNELGKAGHRYQFRVSGREVATSPDHAQILLLREPLDPRAASVEVQVEDLNARKRGILYLFTGKRKNGTAEGSLVPPPFVGKRFGVSDIQFAWEVHEGSADSPFEKNGLDVVPNPSRGYGLFLPRVTAYYEVYDLRDSANADHTYLIDYGIQAPSGKTVRTIPDTVRADSPEWVKVMTFDVADLPSGEYTLTASIRDSANGGEAASSRSFNLLWKSGSWDRTEQDILNEARVLFTEDEYNRFRTMSAGDREQYVQQFWMNADPDPTTAGNPVRQEFLRRVAYANRHFGTDGKGMISDRGRIYIRFGEPDEVERQLLPTQNDQLDQLVAGLTEENPAGRTLATNDEIDVRPFEIWTYTRQGHPLFPERERTTSVTGLKFVFVDESGTGRYILRYSSDFIGY
jgi:GWxTD domain-containing protein